MTEQLILDLGVGVLAHTIVEVVKVIAVKIKSDKPADYNRILEDSIREVSQIINAQNASPNYQINLQELIGHSDELLSNPALFKDKFMSLLSQSLPNSICHKIFNEVEALFFNALYEKGVKDEKEFRRTIISRVNQMLLRQNKVEEDEETVLQAISEIAKNQNNWIQAIEKLNRIEESVTESLSISKDNLSITKELKNTLGNLPEVVKQTQLSVEEAKRLIAGLNRKGDSSTDFLLKEMYKTITRFPSVFGHVLLIFACPLNPISGYYDFNEYGYRQMLREMVEPWG